MHQPNAKDIEQIKRHTCGVYSTCYEGKQRVNSDWLYNSRLVLTDSKRVFIGGNRLVYNII